MLCDHLEGLGGVGVGGRFKREVCLWLACGGMHMYVYG